MQENNEEKVAYKGILLATVCGILFMLFFYAINGGL